jgi:hypothetical protein
VCGVTTDKLCTASEINGPYLMNEETKEVNEHLFEKRNPHESFGKLP